MKEKIILLETVAQFETLLHLYIFAKRELNLVHGFIADVAQFPVVQSSRDAISRSGGLTN
jgi:hypothetical protein